jgi:CRISPR-associated endonuclease/helicase Cas3
MYAEWFTNVTRHPQPHSWQLQLGETEALADRLIRIQTGFGKTIGIAASWYFHAVGGRELADRIAAALAIPISSAPACWPML